MSFDDKGHGLNEELFSDNAHGIYAVHKPDAGDRYSLTEERFSYLVEAVQHATGRLDACSKHLASINDFSAISIFKKQGDRPVLSALGLLADHFNLIRFRKVETSTHYSAKWTYPMEPPKNMIMPSSSDLALLVRTVKGVIDFTATGLKRDLLFRGLKADKSKDTFGIVTSRAKGSVFASGTVVPKSRIDKLHPEQKKWMDKKPNDRREEILWNIPKLKSDKIFLSQKHEAKGNIHVDFARLVRPTMTVAQQLLGDDKDGQFDWPMPWIIIHEGTHKFARTRDIREPACYSEKKARDFQWHEAVRNAQHYMWWAGLDWGALEERVSTPNCVTRMSRNVPQE